MIRPFFIGYFLAVIVNLISKLDVHPLALCAVYFIAGTVAGKILNHYAMVDATTTLFKWAKRQGFIDVRIKLVKPGEHSES